MSRRAVIELEDIYKRFYIGTPNELTVLNGINLTIYEGEFVAVVGASGSGKSTLMNIIGALDRPTQGQYHLDGVDMVAARDRELSGIRNRKIGFVFQTYNLIAKTNALKNVEMPMLYGGVTGRKRVERARELLTMVGMEDRMKHLPEELSGGQKQRVAIARALISKPAIILADEPTGNLDSRTGDKVIDLLKCTAEKFSQTIVMITHNPQIAEKADVRIRIEDGRIA